MHTVSTSQGVLTLTSHSAVAGPISASARTSLETQLRALFSRLAERVSSIEAGEPDYLISNFINGIKRMPVSVSPQ